MLEEEIRPNKIFEEYLKLAEKDLWSYFYDVPYYYLPCPACGSNTNTHQFRKSLFDYVECQQCNTLFVNPRPGAEVFNRYYFESPSMDFFASNFYKETEKNRRNLLIKPKAKKTLDYVNIYYGPIYEGDIVIDIGGGYGVFCEELKKLLPKTNPIITIEPSRKLQRILEKKKIIAIPKFFENVEREDFKGGKVIAVTCFELLEHLHEPNVFLSKCNQILDRGSLLILTTLAWDGFDLQTLRYYSKSITPPQHINFFTKKSISILLNKHGFENCLLSTPGMLDADIVSKEIMYVKDPFLKEILSGDLHVKEQFQNFLQNVKLSSHMLVVAKKR